MAENVQIQISADASQAENSLRVVQRSLAGLGQEARALTSPLDGLSAAIGAIGIGALAKSAIDAALQIERLQKLFAAAAGSANLGGRELEYVKDVANRLGLDVLTAAESYGKFMASIKNTTLEGERGRKVFESVSGATAALGLSADDTKGIFNALQQMMSKGKVQAEELRGQLGERLPGAFKMAADAMGITTAELDKQLKDGKVLADDLLPRLAEQLDKTYGQAAAQGANSAQAAINRMNNAMLETKGAAGAALIPVFTDIVKAITPALGMIQEFIGGLQILFIKLASLPDRVANVWNVIKSGKGIFSKEGLAAYSAGSSSIDANVESTIADLMKRYTPQGSDYTAAERAHQASIKPTKLIPEIDKNAINEYNRFVDKWNSFMSDIEEKNPALDKHQKHMEKLANDLQKFAADNPKYAKEINGTLLPYLTQTVTRYDEITKAIEESKKELKDYADAAEAVAEMEKRNVKEALEDKKRLQDMDRLRITMAMSQVDAQERLNKLTIGEAAGQRIDLLRQELTLEQQVYNEIQGSSPESDLLRLQELDKIQKINQSLEQQKTILEDQTWIGAARNGFNEYARSAMDAGAQIKAAINDAFNGMTDALFNFVKTGKLEFKSMINSILDDITRMSIKTMITGPLSNWLGSVASSAMGSGSSMLSGLGSLAGSIGLKSLFSGGTSGAAMNAAYSGTGGVAATTPTSTAGFLGTIAPFAGAGAASYAWLNMLLGSGGTWNNSTGIQQALRGGAYGSIIGAPLGLLDSLTGGGLFGTKWNTKTSGYDIGISGGGVDASSWAYAERKKALLGGSEGKWMAGSLPAEATAAMNTVWGAITQGIKDGAGKLGIDVTRALADLHLDKSRIFGTSDSIDKLFADMGEKALLKVLPDLEKLGAAGETASQTLQRLQGSFAEYQKTMFTDAEIEARNTTETMKAANAVFGQLGMAVPQTREEFRKLFDQLAGKGDLSGMAALMDLSGAMRQVYDAAEASAKALREQAQANVNAAMTALQKSIETEKGSAKSRYDAEVARIKAGEDAARAAYEASQAFARQQIDDQVRLQKEAYQKQSDALKAAYDAQAAVYKQQEQAAREYVSKLSAVASRLKGAFDSLAAPDAGTLLARQAAQAQIRGYVKGGGLPMNGELDAALSTVTQSGADLFGTSVDYRRDAALTAIDLRTLSDRAGYQLSAAEQQLAAIQTAADVARQTYDMESAKLQTANDTAIAALQAQLSSAAFDNSAFAAQYAQAQTIYDQEVARLDGIWQQAQDQVNAINGTTDAVLSVQAAIAALQVELAELRKETIVGNNAVAKYTKKMADIVDKWDGDGMPAVAV